MACRRMNDDIEKYYIRYIYIYIFFLLNGLIFLSMVDAFHNKSSNGFVKQNVVLHGLTSITSFKRDRIIGTF